MRLPVQVSGHITRNYDLAYMPVFSNPSLDELRAFFKGISLPDKLQLYPGTTVSDVTRFKDAQLTIAESQDSELVSRLAYERLLRLKEVIEKQG